MALPSFGLTGFDQSMIFDLTELLANEESFQALNPDALVKQESSLDATERIDSSPIGLPILNRRRMDFEESSGYAPYPSFMTQDPNLMWNRMSERKIKIEDMDQNLKIFPIEEDDSIQMMDNCDYTAEPTLSALNNVMLSDMDLEEFLLPVDLPGLEKFDPADPNSYNAQLIRTGETLFSSDFRFQDSIQENHVMNGAEYLNRLDGDSDYSQRDMYSGGELKFPPNRIYPEQNRTPEKPLQRHGSVGSLQQALQQHTLSPLSSSVQPGQSLLSSALSYGGREVLNRKRTLESAQDTLLSSSPKLSLLNPPSPGMPYRRSPGHEPSPLSPMGLPPASSRNQSSSSRYRQRANTLHGFVSHRSSTHSPSPGPSRTGRIASPGPLKMTQPPQGITINSPGTSQSRLSSSAPTHTGLDLIWQRREPRQHLLSTSSIAGEFNSVSSLSGSVLSPTSFDVSHDEGFDSDDDSELEHFDDDSGSDCDSETEGGKSTSGGKKERYFWQYNVQSKGPKGRKVVMQTEILDPHILDSVKDPVFDISMEGVKHSLPSSGKARRGDGNDLTPSPRKLASIGKELEKLNRLINEMTPVSELPAAVRPDTRKEKNKLASRVCRLKKKAQHEANKLKLYGLQEEHKKLMSVIVQVKQLLAAKYENELLTALGTSTEAESKELTSKIENFAKHGIKHKIAGNTADYVNRVIDRVYSGDPTGGVDDI